jgi:transcriptional regulator with XRE-family HTH domain
MTQTELGWPLTKGFVSEVERGRSLPSLGALVLMAQRLGVPVSYLLGEVKGGLSPVYTPPDENEHPPANSGR